MRKRRTGPAAQYSRTCGAALPQSRRRWSTSAAAGTCQGVSDVRPEASLAAVVVSDASIRSRAQMPIQPPNKDTEEMEAEGDSATEMNGEEEESEEERSGSQTESEEESSEMDDEDYERRRSECVNEMLDLEKQFSELKEKLFRERLSQLRVRLEEVGAERAPEYTEPLGGLQRSLKIRIQVAGIYKGFCLDVIRNKYECELQGAKQHLESEKLLLYDTLQGELQERIQRLEEDRQSLDISSEWWDDKLHARGSSKTWDSLPPSKRKKAPLVSGPYIVYMLQEIDILEDWTAIKRLGQLCPHRRENLMDRDPAPRSNWHQAQDSHFPAAKRQTHKPLRVCPAALPCCCWAPPSSHHWPGRLLCSSLGPVQLWPGAALARPESIPNQPPTFPSPRSASLVPSLTRHCLS
ncbi:breast cancer metastasis-suppressor 1 isoform X5 [Pteropus vampyrus]|uniref:Breast cancer metastasis-suppressor 1 isoform X5 n=1 Tax=Pteropus vampyrus TaxID=132908 RepID=A0A6P6CW07_PTEVA|nr:breast cancer metastasis-suppressor 1 isoform X5 [Pteropus vampyrus]